MPGIMKDPRHRRTVWRYPLQVQVRKTQSGIGVRRSGLPTALAKLVLRVAVPFGCAGSSLFAHRVSADDLLRGVLPAASGQSDGSHGRNDQPFRTRVANTAAVRWWASAGASVA
ncbi:MAG: hypothetical protein QOJ06_2635 [Pseudonocardiales bacterium]|nr:hypothetical protein [Pseudonocardiales bacterium]